MKLSKAKALEFRRLQRQVENEMKEPASYIYHERAAKQKRLDMNRIIRQSGARNVSEFDRMISRIK